MQVEQCITESDLSDLREKCMGLIIAKGIQAEAIRLAYFARGGSHNDQKTFQGKPGNDDCGI